MPRDAQLMLSEGQAVTGSAASTNYLDLKAAVHPGEGEEVWVEVVCTVAMTDSGSDSTVAVILETATDTAFSDNATVMTIGTFAATSAIGTKFQAVLPKWATKERYLRAWYTIANGNLTTGSFDCHLFIGGPQSEADYRGLDTRVSY